MPSILRGSRPLPSARCFRFSEVMTPALKLTYWFFDEKLKVCAGPTMDRELKPGQSRLRARVRHLFGSYLSVSDIQWILTDKLNADQEFLFNNQKLHYFFHSYNNFRLSERAIEIPIIDYFLKEKSYERVLEIGNVTNHYYDYFRQTFVDRHKTVVDKFERGD